MSYTLSSDELRALLSYDPETGGFRWRSAAGRWGRIPAGSVAGSINKIGYSVIGIKGRLYSAHRLAWLYMTGEWPTQDIDHKNGIRNDNCWSNLRLASRSENLCNQVQRPSMSGLKGVHLHKATGLWMASVTKNYKVHASYHSTAHEAAAARAEMASRLHGEFARV